MARSLGVVRVLVLAGVLAGATGASAANENNKLRVLKSPKTGLASFVTAADGGAIPLAIPVPGARPQPEDFLGEHGHLFGISDAAKQLAVVGTARDALGHRHTTYHQVHKGVPVFSGVIKVHQNDRGAVIAANGDFHPISTKLTTTPTIDSRAAESSAKAAIASGRPSVERSELVIVDPGWYGDPPAGEQLAYYLILTDETVPLREAFFVDAHSGRLLDQWNVLHTNKYREVHDGMGAPMLPGTLVRSEGDQPVGTPADADRAYDYGGDVYDFLYKAFGRDSIDDSGMTLVLTVNSTAPACPNAYWSGQQMVFCSGTVTDDITAHEIGHGVTERTANLIYQNQPGQLNESYSDIFGELVDLFNGDAAILDPPGGAPQWPEHPTGPGLDTPNILRSTCSYSPSHSNGVRWLMGEDATVFGGAIRDMWRPSCMGHPNNANHPYQTCYALDNGGVHSGSGVSNHAFAIVSDGKAYNGQTVSAIGVIKAGAVWYRALATYLTVASDFEDAYVAIKQAAIDLIGSPVIDPRNGEVFDTFTAGDAQEVDKALLAVEMNTEGACGATVPVLNSDPPERCSSRTTIFIDDFETGVGDWTVSNSGPTGPPTPYDWEQITGDLPDARPGTVWFCDDPSIGDCSSWDESAVHSLFSPIITLPEGIVSPTLEFTHYVATEGGWDGGNLKISVNGGPWTLIPSVDFEYNPYNAVLNSVGAGNTNPLAGEEGWTSAGGSWGTSLVGLAGFVSGGAEIQFRFDFGKDGCTGLVGWLIDDVELYTCGFLDPPIEPSAPFNLRKNRHVAVNANNPDTPVAIKIEWLEQACSGSGMACTYDRDCWVCVDDGKPCSSSADCSSGDCRDDQTCDTQSAHDIGWVGEACRIPADTQVSSETYTALVVNDMPPLQIFPPTVFVTDCEIQPRRTYVLRATRDGVVFSDPLVVGTILEPRKNSKKWADVVGHRDIGTGEYTGPNLRINVDDVGAFIAFLNGKPYRPHLTVLDLSHEVVDYRVNADDLSMTLRAFNISEDYPPLKFQAEASGATRPDACPYDPAATVHDKCE